MFDHLRRAPENPYEGSTRRPGNHIAPYFLSVVLRYQFKVVPCDQYVFGAYQRNPICIAETSHVRQLVACGHSRIMWSEGVGFSFSPPKRGLPRTRSETVLTSSANVKAMPLENARRADRLLTSGGGKIANLLASLDLLIPAGSERIRGARRTSPWLSSKSLTHVYTHVSIYLESKKRTIRLPYMCGCESQSDIFTLT